MKAILRDKDGNTSTVEAHLFLTGLDIGDDVVVWCGSLTLRPNSLFLPAEGDRCVLTIIGDSRTGKVEIVKIVSLTAYFLGTVDRP